MSFMEYLTHALSCVCSWKVWKGCTKLLIFLLAPQKVEMHWCEVWRSVWPFIYQFSRKLFYNQHESYEHDSNRSIIIQFSVVLKLCSIALIHWKLNQLQSFFSLKYHRTFNKMAWNIEKKIKKFNKICWLFEFIFLSHSRW